MDVQERPVEIRLGSRALLTTLADRILRLTLTEQVASAIPPSDLDQLQHRAQESLETLGLTDGSAAWTPALCSLAVECINVVQRAELTTGPARLVCAGCELLAALLGPQAADRKADAAGTEGWTFDWVSETLEEISDQLDFLALEVYCGLGRLEGAVAESDALPVVEDPDVDFFGAYWGSIEHRQALQELSAWLLCVVFRAIGYDTVTAKSLMEFAGSDAFCLCSLLRGLLALRPCDSQGLPDDVLGLQRIALAVLCGLSSPALAFPNEELAEDAGGMEEQNRVLYFYMDMLCAAMLETRLLETCIEAALAPGVEASSHGEGGERLLSFLAALALHAEEARQAPEPDPRNPALRLQEALAARAERLGALLEKVLESRPVRLAELVASCAALSSAVASARPESEDGLTLACRALLAACLDEGRPESQALWGSGNSAGPTALLALAASVDDLSIHRASLVQLMARLQPAERARARARLLRTDRQRLAVRGSREALLAVLPEEDDAELAAPAMSVVGSETAQKPQVVPPHSAQSRSSNLPGLRDIVQNAPVELRCAVDGKLLCDPVVTPDGIIFERATILRCLQNPGALCPVTGKPLRIEDCKRCPETRKKVTEWARKEARVQRQPRRSGRKQG